MYKDPDKMSERELRREVKEWRQKWSTYRKIRKKVVQYFSGILVL